MAVPGINEVFTGGETNAAIRQLVTDIRFAQQMAIGEGRIYYIAFYKTTQLYRIRYANDPEPVIVRQVFFPEGLTLLGTNFHDDTLSFNIMGAPSAGGTIGLLDNRGKPVEITVLPATGRVRVYR